MALYQAGRITESQLEAYRICASLDAQDPAAVLGRSGQVPDTRPQPAELLLQLRRAAARYLSTLPGDGATEARAALARQPWDVSPPATPRDNPVLRQWLGPALDLVAPDRPELAASIAAAAPLLVWITYDSYPRDQIGESFATGHAFASLVGEGSPFPGHDFDLGLFLIAPRVLYRDHRHAAPELYAPLTGPHDWRFGPGAPLVTKPAHVPVWNDPHAPHLTRVGHVPFLAFYCWTRDVNELAEVIPADDWGQLEEARP
jgi:hypothetical protein